MLALEWCRLRQHYYDIFKVAEDIEHMYTDAELESYKEHIEWVEWLLARGVDSPSWTRAHVVNSDLPSKTPGKMLTTGAASSSSTT